MRLKRLFLPAAVAATVLVAACGSDSEPRPTLKAPDSDTPASGICAEVPEGNAVAIVINEDVPSPRCSKIEADQRVEVVNKTGGQVRVQLAQFDLTLELEEKQLLDLPAGEYLAPGVHVIRASSLAGGPEVWLVREDVSGPGATPEDGCPVADDVCAFAAAVNRAVQSSDFGALVSSARAQEYACPSPRPQGLGGPYPLCDGAVSGETRSGYEVAYLSSEGVVVDARGLQEALDRWAGSADPSASDAFGGGGSHLYAVGCATGGEACGDRFSLVFSQLRSGVPARIELILYFEQAQVGQAQLVWTAIGPLLEPSQQQVALSGGSTQDFLSLQGWPPLTTFYALPQ